MSDASQTIASLRELLGKATKFTGWESFHEPDPVAGGEMHWGVRRTYDKQQPTPADCDLSAALMDNAPMLLDLAELAGALGKAIEHIDKALCDCECCVNVEEYIYTHSVRKALKRLGEVSGG
jgi:hypothetical protein